jgi:hypothetical protein
VEVTSNLIFKPFLESVVGSVRLHPTRRHVCIKSVFPSPNGGLGREVVVILMGYIGWHAAVTGSASAELH